MNGTTRQEWREARRAHRRSMRGGGQGSQLMGIVLIAIGAVYLGSNLGWLPNVDFRSLWPLILILLGVSDLTRYFTKGSRGHAPVFGLIMTSVGTVFLLRNLGLLPRDVWRYIWPLLLMGWGVTMLLRRARPEGWPTPTMGEEQSTTSANSIREFVTFGSLRRKVQSLEFEGGSIQANFGGVELDLREAATSRAEVTIEAHAHFGGIEIRVPDAWDVTVSGVGVFGSFEDETSAKPTPGSNRPRLLVTGEAVFGGVSVKN